METFVTTIFCIILLFYVLKLTFRWWGPLVMKFAAKKVAKRFGAGFEGSPFDYNDASKQSKEDYKRPSVNTRKSTKVVGEYVDFEEVE